MRREHGGLPSARPRSPDLERRGVEPLIEPWQGGLPERLWQNGRHPNSSLARFRFPLGMGSRAPTPSGTADYT